ncbi:MAG: hypothetical protein H7Z43_06565, partial [Clostridia bacterium]|nr:hypothetical protein [Deltaproteobacteria bacterium]
LVFQGGAEAIARLAKASIVHIGIHYGFHENEKPDLDIVIGTPRETVDAAWVEELLTRVPAQTTIYAARTISITARLLAWLTHPSTK